MNSLKLEISPCDTQGTFFDESGRTDLSPSRLVHQNSLINDEAVFSVLQFGAIIPPLTPWKGVHRFLPGYNYQGTKIIGQAELRQHTSLSNIDLESQADLIEMTIDRILKKHIGENEDPVLLFSGGVDSGIIASRLAALGYRNSLLINFSFGEDDPESKLAEEMAGELGLTFKRVSGKARPCGCLDYPGEIYTQPFGDHSTAATSDLANSVVKFLSKQQRVIIDGTGADGAFGMASKIKFWSRLTLIPDILKKLASIAYEQRLWKHNGKIEYIGRILRRSVEMPLLSAVLAQNPLSGIFYSNKQKEKVHQLLETWINGYAGESIAMRIIAGDLSLTCANIFAQKAKPILELAGHKVLYPFLEEEMLSMALRSALHWRMVQPKAPLKQSLARNVPRNMVYRPKSGFVDPKGELFFDVEFIEHLRSAAETTSPIAHMLEPKRLLETCDLLGRKRALPPQTFNLLWAVVFTDRWYRTASPRSNS